MLKNCWPWQPTVAQTFHAPANSTERSNMWYETWKVHRDKHLLLQSSPRSLAGKGAEKKKKKSRTDNENTEGFIRNLRWRTGAAVLNVYVVRQASDMGSSSRDCQPSAEHIISPWGFHYISLSRGAHKEWRRRFHGQTHNGQLESTRPL